MVETAMRIVTPRSGKHAGVSRPVEIHIHYRLPACVVTAQHGAPYQPTEAASLESALKPLENHDVHRVVQEQLCKLFAEPESGAGAEDYDSSKLADSLAKGTVCNQVAERQSTLTPRESEVMELMLTGKSQKQIAAELHVSIQTAAKHRAKVLEKLKVANDVELLRLTLSLDTPSS
jgi:DNA-binding CsgD family transcriptional regulator